jgi:hypothetical protein
VPFLTAMNAYAKLWVCLTKVRNWGILLTEYGSCHRRRAHRNYGPICSQAPGSILQLDPDFTLVADEAALSLVKDLL